MVGFLANHLIPNIETVAITALHIYFSSVAIAEKVMSEMDDDGIKSPIISDIRPENASSSPDLFPVQFAETIYSIQNYNVELFTKHFSKAALTSPQSNALALIVIMERLAIIDRLIALKAGSIKNANGDTLWHLAAKHQNHAVLVHLRQSAIAPTNCKNRDGKTVLDVAVDSLDYKLVYTILYAGFSKFNVFDSVKSTPIFSLLVNETNANIFQVNRMGQSILHAACIHNNYEVAKATLGEGIDPNREDSAGFTAMHYSIKNGNLALLMLLHANGALLNKPKTYFFAKSAFKPALIEAVKSRDLLILQFLLENDADVNAVDEEGNTALHVALSLGYSNQVLIELIEAGADVRKRNNKKVSPIRIFFNSLNYEVLSKLVELKSSAIALPKPCAHASGPSSTCPICREALPTNDVVYTLSCSHTFHRDCLDHWITSNASCPLCRALIPKCK